MPDDPVLGIDFGTRTSRAAIQRDDGTRLVSGWIGEETVSHTDGETIHVGGSPTAVAASFPDRTVGSAKCYLRDVAEDPLEFLRPQAFAATVLRQLKQRAEADLGEPVPGAAIAGGIRSGHVTDVVTLPVLSRSLGVEVDGGGFETLVERNTTLPTEESKLFTTASDDQTAVDVGVRQGGADVAAENDRLDHVRLRGVTAGASERPRIEVTVRVDVGGNVTVDAGDLSSGDGETVPIADGLGLSEDEITARRGKLPDRMERVE